MPRLSSLVCTCIVFTTFSARACPDCQDNRCVPFVGCACVPKIGCTVSVPIPGTSNSPNALPGPGGTSIPSPVPLPPPVAQSVIDAANQGMRDIAANVEKGFKDIGANVSKSNEDVKAEAARAKTNLEDAGRAVVHYVENEVKSSGQGLSNAERRIREGKVVDALWHLGTERVQASESNAAAAAQESELLRTVGAAAASAYGGPAGAAAYAAWLTYKQTGNAELALRVGILTGASSAAFGAAGDMPSGTTFELAQKTVVTGAIGGLAVAAAGGNEEAIKAGFLSAGAMVLVQDGYKKYTGHPLDAKSSEGEAYCMTPGEACSPPDAAMLNTDENGKVTLDMSKVNPKTPAVGVKVDPSKVSWQSEGSPLMTSVSRVPGMQAMAIFHDTWTMSWDSDLLVKASIVPAVVITYTGTGAPYFDLVKRTAIEADVASKYKSEEEHPSTKINGAALPRSTANVPLSFLCLSGPEARQIYVDLGRRSEGGPVCRVAYRRTDAAAVLHYSMSDAKACNAKAETLAKAAVKAGWTCAVGSKADQAARARRIASERKVPL